MSEHAFLSVICRDDTKCAVLWIRTITGGPTQGESPPVQVKKSYIQIYSSGLGAKSQILSSVAPPRKKHSIGILRLV